MQIFDIEYLVSICIFMFSWSKSLHIWKNQWVFCLIFVAITNKNKPAQPPLFSLFQDSEGTNPSTETNNTSYESRNTQLSGDGRIIIMEAPSPPPVKCFGTFSFWGRGRKLRLIKFRLIDQVKYPHFRWPYNCFLLRISSLNTLYLGTF